MIQKVIRICLTVAVFLPLHFMFTSNSLNIITIGGVKFSPLLSIAFGILPSVLPGVFDMGVEKFKQSSFVPRLQPLLVTLPTIYCFQFIPQTYITVIFVSYLAGMSASYIGKIIKPEG